MLEALPAGYYRTVLADPPWPESGGGKVKRGADAHYPLMKVRDIEALGEGVARISAPDSHLYLWVTNNYMEAGYGVMRAWGFRPVTVITWGKLGKIGLGQYYRGLTEHMLFGVRGVLPYKLTPEGGRVQGKTLYMAPREEHSVKPNVFMDEIEVVSYEPRIELFSRRRRIGWDAWGNEVQSGGA